MNLNVSHIRLTDRMISDLYDIVEFDKKICKIRNINFDELYGDLSVTGYIAEILNRELVRQDAVLCFYGLDEVQFADAIAAETEENTSESE